VFKRVLPLPAKVIDSIPVTCVVPTPAAPDTGATVVIVTVPLIASVNTKVSVVPVVPAPLNEDPNAFALDVVKISAAVLPVTLCPAPPKVTLLVPEPLAVNDWPTPEPKVTTDAAVELAFVTAKLAVLGNVKRLVPVPAVRLMFSTLTKILAPERLKDAEGAVEIVKVSLPVPPLIDEETMNAAVAEIASSNVVVTAEAFVEAVVERLADAAVNEMVEPVPCAPNNRSGPVKLVTPGKEITVSKAF
jgi:hypothetical protein